MWVLAKDETEQDRKVAALGLRFAQGVTIHGFALNCARHELGWTSRIIPCGCGIPDADVTTLSREPRPPGH